MGWNTYSSINLLTCHWLARPLPSDGIATHQLAMDKSIEDSIWDF